VHLESVFFNRRSCCEEKPVQGNEGWDHWLEHEKKVNNETNKIQKTLNGRAHV